MVTKTTKLWIKNPVYTTNLQTGESSFKQEWYVPQVQKTPQQTVQPTETVPTPNFKDQKTTTIQPTPVPFTDIQKIEQDKQAQAREPIKQKETPVTLKSWQEVMLNAQEVKMREQNLRNQELQTKTAEKQAKMTDLSNFLANNPDKTSINRYLKINYAPEYRAEYQNTLKAYFKQADTIKKTQKYSTATPDVIDEAVKSGELVPWTEAYNALPPEKRQEYEEYATIKQRSQLLDPYKAPKTDFTTILESLKSVFSTNYKKDYQDRLNSSEVTQYTKDLENISTQISDIDKSIENIAKERAWVAKWVPSSLQRGQNAQDIQALLDEKNTLINQYTAKKATLDSIKDDINTELEIARIDDENTKQTYMTALSLYNTERSRMDVIEQRNFEAESKLRAEERQRDFQKEMLQLQQDFETKNQKPTYQIWRDWKMYAIVDWQAQVVKSDMWEVLFWEEKEEFQTSVQKNDDGTFSVFQIPKNWGTPIMSTYGASWELAWGTPWAIADVITQCRINGQCWQGANDYAEKLWLGRIFWDPYESKKEYVNSQSPQVWGFAIWNPQQWQGKFKDNWHVGIVTNYNAQTGKVTITDWNWNGDEKQQTHDVNLSEITFNGGFYNPWVTSQWREYTDEDIALLGSFTKLDKQAKQTLKEAGLTAQDWAKMDAWLLPPTPKQKQQAQEILNTISSLEIDPWFSMAIWKSSFFNVVPWTAWMDFLNRFNSFRDNIVLPNLWQLKWPMSDKDIQFLRNSATALNVNMSEAWFKKELNKLKEKYAKIAWVETTPQVQETPVQKPQTWSLEQEFSNYVSDTDLQWIFNK